MNCSKTRSPSVSYFKAFESKCFIYNNGKENLYKFDPRSREGISVGHSLVSKAYRAHNKCTKVIEESIHVIFDETNNGLASSFSFDELQLRKYVDDEDEGALDKSNHKSGPSNMGQSLNQDDHRQLDDIGVSRETS